MTGLPYFVGSTNMNIDGVIYPVRSNKPETNISLENTKLRNAEECRETGKESQVKPSVC